MKLTLVKKQEVARGTVSFFWEADPPFIWRPGQFLYYTIPLPKPDPRGNTRHFTIASSPTEKLIQLTTRIRDESLYKQTLNKLELGAVVEGSGPRGDFVLDEERDTPQVFLAGGIGITPFRSMIKYATDQKLKTPIHLIYSNSTPEDIIFKNELDGWTTENPNFKLSYTITISERITEWDGMTGRIDKLMIGKLIGNWKLEIGNCIFWLCGPPAFVSGVQDELQKLGISGDSVEVEEFTGY